MQGRKVAFEVASYQLNDKHCSKMAFAFGLTEMINRRK
jgi:hypothetical protein